MYFLDFSSLFTQYIDKHCFLSYNIFRLGPLTVLVKISIERRSVYGH
nr:MAG TPA: hypothetical protein [Caudoviricetes sp.]